MVKVGGGLIKIDDYLNDFDLNDSFTPQSSNQNSPEKGCKRRNKSIGGSFEGTLTLPDRDYD
jgi:hypothetical protein